MLAPQGLWWAVQIESTKTSTRPSEVSGKRVGQQLNRGRQKGVQKCTPVQLQEEQEEVEFQM